MGSNGQTEAELSDIYLWLAGLTPASTDPDFPAALATPASVITNSFGGHLPNIWPISVLMDLTLRSVTDNGRGGLGTLMFFSVGNGFSANFWTRRPYASHARTMGIGSVTDGDVKAGYSNWGDSIDLCTPSSGGTKGIMTTTIPGDGDTAGHTGGALDYNSSFGGTSASTPLAAGVAALVLSMDPTLTWQEVRTILIRTAERIDTGNTDLDGLWRDDDGDGVDEYSWWYGFGMVDAARAVCVARNTIRVEPTVAFIDVPEEETAIRPVTIRVHGWRPRTFEVSAGPTTTVGPADSFLLHAGDSVAREACFECREDALHIWLKYTGTTDGDIAEGAITIRCIETGEEFPVALSANTIVRPKTALVMALDRSGSMNDSAGDGRLKIQLVRDGAAVVPVLADSETGLGAVRWDTDADLAEAMAVEEAGEESIGLGRIRLTTFISNHATNISGLTAIGDAVEAAQSLLDDATGYDEKAMVVLTDGNETASKYISELSADDLHAQIFAIGVGTPENLNPGALDTLTGLHGGYMVLTGETTVDDQFLLTKYFQQILAGVTNTEIVVDPQGLLTPGVPATHHIPVNETDREIDVIVHSWFPSLIHFTLQTPDGKTITPGDTGSFDSRYVVGHGSMYYRLKLPNSLVGPQDPSQPWIARLKLNEAGWHRMLEWIKKGEKEEEYALARTLVHGLQYAFTTQARSSLRMDVKVTQSSREPGAIAWIMVKLTEYGYPLKQKAKIACELFMPDGGKSDLELDAMSDGVYQGSFQVLVTGAWRVTIRAQGTTTAGNPFQRQVIRTVSVWPDGNKPAPDKPKEDPITRFLRCICERGVIDPEIAKKYGVDMRRLCECLSQCSCEQLSSPKLTSHEIAKVSRTVAEVLRRSL
jgi:subtilisin family serine protease